MFSRLASFSASSDNLVRHSQPPPPSPYPLWMQAAPGTVPLLLRGLPRLPPIKTLPELHCELQGSQPDHALAALIAFIQPKVVHAQNRPFIERSLDEAERAFPQFTDEFERARHGYRLQSSMHAGGSISSASGSGAASPTSPVSPRARSPAGRRPSADVDPSLGTALAAASAPAARDRVRQPPGAVRNPVSRELAEADSEDPPPLYAADDPDPESTRLLEQRLAAEAEAADVVVGGTDVAAATDTATATHGATPLDIVGTRSDGSALRAPSPPPSLLSVSAPAYSHLEDWTSEPAPQYVPPAGGTTATTTPELSVSPAAAASRRTSLPEAPQRPAAATAMSSPLTSTATSASNRIRRSDPIPVARPAAPRIEPTPRVRPRPRIGSAAMPLAPPSPSSRLHINTTTTTTTTTTTSSARIGSAAFPLAPPSPGARSRNPLHGATDANGRPRLGFAAMPLAPASPTGLRRQPAVPGEPEGMSAWRAHARRRAAGQLSAVAGRAQ